ncbi:replicative DNA helicase [Candidatus Dojkabacteria bacterium]|uniref:Replicative DNA helicase n=1 Tax=Candidatus Dojkabacteria bacterium TaxID=2099670 RepID=A0A955RK70_9BACT|nr:replicative DNA helicase [Candidatus Dojkabacteria bacterium]
MSTKLISPQNLDAERGVLGSILIDEDAILKIYDKLVAVDFYQPKHRIIYDAMLKLFHSQEAIDVLTLTSKLTKSKKLKTVGGATYITELVESVPTAAHAEQYAELVKKASVRRNLIHFAGEIQKLAYEEDKPVSDVLNEAEKGIFHISEGSVKQDFVHVSDLLEEAYEKAAELSANQDIMRGIKTGFSGLDNILGGFQDSDLVILAARPSVGKSAVCMDFARHAAVAEKKSVGIFSLEMSNLQVMDRILAMQVGVGLWDLRMGKLSEDNLVRLGDAMGILSESNIYVDDTPGLTIHEIRTKCRRLKMEKGLDFVVIDYLQLISGSNKESRVQEVSEISRMLKIIAKELHIPVIAAAQLSRAIEQRGGDRRPQLSDLRESGSIEQDADIVMFLQREEIFNPDTERKGIGDLLVAKHRNGPTGNVELFFEREQARYRQLEKNFD